MHLALVEVHVVKPGTLWRQTGMSKRLSTKINTFVKVERTGDKVERTGDDVAGLVDFVSSSFDCLHIHEHVLIL